ncbi:RagB/SusD family nutrient uptake outer membrane protein [Pedobacter sp. AW31-3R]|uniref:RagB/SusD family nutrient uptake outer membrane protein n=1 Tax=Pedobacter sp. AW31-3R TaxID=3445781 RepID=UPI003FA0BCD4
MKLKISLTILTSLILISSACKKLTDGGLPKSLLTDEKTFAEDATAIAAITNTYATISGMNIPADPFKSIGLRAGLSADELSFFNGYPPSTSGFDDLLKYYQNSVTPANATPWIQLYSFVYNANVAINSLNSATTLSPGVKQQLLGEMKFIRAYMYFYLVNLYGDVPLALSGDYTVNQQIGRSPRAQVYQQIVQDLTEAQTDLSDSYVDGTLLSGTTERVRPNKWAATALLARTYLYTGEYEKAETQAGMVIDHTSLYSLPALNDAFLKNSRETIWSTQPVGTLTLANTAEGRTFILTASGPSTANPVYLSNQQLSAFSAGDLRGTVGYWIGSVTVSGATYFYPTKYKIGSVSAATAEYSMMLRLAEQYLIRAEARAKLGKIAAAAEDLNVLRTRARAAETTALPNPLPPISGSLSPADILTAVMKERQLELFTEWGHRWLDLRRAGTIDAVMTIVTPLKVISTSTPNNWNNAYSLYPIPQAEIDRSPLLNGHQNPGY